MKKNNKTSQCLDMASSESSLIISSLIISFLTSVLVCTELNFFLIYPGMIFSEYCQGVHLYLMHCILEEMWDQEEVKNSG